MGGEPLSNCGRNRCLRCRSATAGGWRWIWRANRSVRRRMSWSSAADRARTFSKQGDTDPVQNTSNITANWLLENRRVKFRISFMQCTGMLQDSDTRTYYGRAPAVASLDYKYINSCHCAAAESVTASTQLTVIRLCWLCSPNREK